MKSRDLQRFFSGKLTEEEKMHLLSLYQNPKGRKILSGAFEEGWNEFAYGKGHVWDSDSCFIKIFEKITTDRDTIIDNDY